MTALVGVSAQTTGVLDLAGLGRTLDSAQSGDASRHELVAHALPVYDRDAPRRGHVLVVEDNLVNQRVAVRLLETIGFSADIAADGIEALKALEQSTYDVVLMDCGMPRMDGFEATKEIRRGATCSRLPIIALTAAAGPADRERCLAVGMNAFLTKPIDRLTLAVVLRQHVGAAPETPEDGSSVAQCGQ